MKRERRKLTLSRETLINLEAGQLGAATGAGTYTASNPCCPPTKTPGCEPTFNCPTALCTKINCP
ncbi:MAG TPA: hypothetical protein VMW75_14765 [Thermoanaerobaculia bacterium]|nr:hypothetical protein [Thermoanaerobaculia bacterium]